jgi:hypothetical protein
MTISGKPHHSVQQLLLSILVGSGGTIAASSAAVVAIVKDPSHINFSDIARFSLIIVTVITAITVTLQKFGSNLFIRFIKRLEDKLGEKVEQLADDCIDSLGGLIQSLKYQAPVRFKDRYLKYIKDFYSDLDLPGSRGHMAFTGDLEEVYISFNFTYDDYEKTPTGRIDEHGLFAVWHALSRGKRAHRQYQPVMITGHPGSGKTTLLKYILLACSGVKRHKSARPFRRLIPVLLPLREVASTILQNPTLDLANVITAQETIHSINPPTGWFQTQLKSRRCLILLDGLDEIASEGEQVIISRWINQQILIYAGSAFIITSRPFVNHKDLIGKAKTFLEIRSLNFKQAEKFIDSWYLQDETQKGYRAKAKKDRKAIEIK